MIRRAGYSMPGLRAFVIQESQEMDLHKIMDLPVKISSILWIASPFSFPYNKMDFKE
jgi:hypothetical protein